MDRKQPKKDIKKTHKRKPSNCSGCSDNPFQGSRDRSNQAVLPHETNTTTLSERSELGKIAKELKERTINESKIDISGSDSDISVSFSSSDISDYRESDPSINNQTEDLNRKIRETLNDLRKEANLYMDSSHRALAELTSVSRRMKESVYSCQSDS